MKTLLQISAIALITLSGCATYQGNSASVYEDDIYYSPSNRAADFAETYSSSPAPDQLDAKQDNKTYSETKSTYVPSDNTQEEDLRDFTSIQEEYTSLLTDDSVEEIDTTLYYDDQTGYWVDEYTGSKMDQDYAERLARFHGPVRGIPYWSPLYTEIIFGAGFDYNVYIEGDYAVVVPNWNSPYYWNWRYGRPYSYGLYGWYSPWNSWGWGMYGYSWYDWNYPYHRNYAYHPHHHHSKSSYIARDRAPRQAITNRVTSSRQAATSKSASSTGVTNIGRSSRSSQTAQSTTSNAGRSTRASYNSGSSTTSTTTNSSEGRSSRTTYVPTYTRTTQNTSGTRSTYNRTSRTPSSYSNNSNNNSSRSNRSSSSTSSVSSKRTYNTGSSSTRSSSYKTRSSSTSTRSSSPSYNSSTRSSSSKSGSSSRSSSGSSSRSSSGSSRSSSGSRGR
jgi:hypothetical protein